MQCITSAEQKHLVDGEGDEAAKHTNSNGAITGSPLDAAQRESGESNNAPPKPQISTAAG
jgi:hypothetical protein